MTLSDLKIIDLLQAILKAILCTVMQKLRRFQKERVSATAELVISLKVTDLNNPSQLRLAPWRAVTLT